MNILSYFGEIGATTLGGRPVTLAEVVYTILPTLHLALLNTGPLSISLRLWIQEQGTGVQLLFKDTNIYFVAFSFILKNKDVNNTSHGTSFGTRRFHSFSPIMT